MVVFLVPGGGCQPYNIEATRALGRFPIPQFALHQDRRGGLRLRLAGDRRIVVLRKGRPADPATLRGLWRFRLRAPDEPDPVFETRPVADPYGFDDDVD